MAKRKPGVKIREIQSICDASLYGGSDLDYRILGFAIDSRAASKEKVFVPVRGERTDGHLYIGEAFRNGCSYSFVDRSFWEREFHSLVDYASRYRGSFIIVENSLKALQVLAEWYMTKQNCEVIGITGSSGKTTSKEIIASIMKQHGNCFNNYGNLNSEYGIPMEVFRMDGNEDWAVFEMGMSYKGEMTTITKIVRPKHVFLTHIGTAHIGNLGSQENIAKEKGEIFNYTDDTSLFVHHEDGEYVDIFARSFKGRQITYSTKGFDHFEGYEDRGLLGYLIRYDGVEIQLSLPGIYNLENALGAICLCKNLGVATADIKKGIETMGPLYGRAEVHQGRINLIKDCYNANPESLMSSLSMLGDLDESGRKIAVLGDMKELGDDSPEIHYELGKKAGRMKINSFVLIGFDMKYFAKGLEESGFSGEIRNFDDTKATSSEIESIVKTNDLVLFKGSRSMELEHVADIFIEKKEV